MKHCEGLTAPGPHASWPQIAGILGLFLAVTACAETQKPDPAYPGSKGALCQQVGLESTETPQHSNVSSTAVMAVYTFDEPNVPPAKDRVYLTAQAERSRTYEPQGQLEGKPQVICSPETGHAQVSAKSAGKPTPTGVAAAPTAPPH
ncbi:MAG: hypothetical protein RL701_3569 [Pseudomonadota bacterium]